MKTPRVCTEEQYLTENGASERDLGEPGLHKTHSRISRKQW